MTHTYTITDGKSKKTHLQTGDGEVGDEADDLWVVFHFDQLTQLVVTLQPRQQAAELVVVVWIGQTLKHKHTLFNTHEATEVSVFSDRCVLPVGLPVSSSLRPPGVTETLLALHC